MLMSVMRPAARSRALRAPGPADRWCEAGCARRRSRLDTCSTSSCTIRACSAGNSSSQSGSSCVSASRTSASVTSVASLARGAPGADDDLRLPEHAAQLLDDHRLDLGRRHPADRAGVAPVLQHVLADVVAVEPVALAGVRRRHRRAGRPEDQPLQQRRRLRPGARRPGAAVLGEDRVHLVPEVLGDDRRVLARIGGALVDREPEVGAVAEALVEVALVDRPALGGQHALGPQLLRQHRRRADRGGTARTSTARPRASGSWTTSFRFFTT